VFHLTTLNSFGEIQRTGEISNNQAGAFTINTGSQNSFGRLNRYVCLFDLRHDDPNIIQNTLDCYYFLGPSWFSKLGRKYTSWDLAYLILDQQYYDQLIPNSRVNDNYRETGEYLQAIPKSEVWIKTKVPLSWIEKILVVRVRELLPDKNTVAGMHYWTAFKAETGTPRGKRA
jgi:hypothetical protein